MTMTTREVLERLAGGELTKEEVKEYFASLHRQGHTIKVDRAHLATIPLSTPPKHGRNGLASEDEPRAQHLENTGLRTAFFSDLREMIARTLRIDAGKIDLNLPVSEYGLSSITVTALLAEFNGRFATSVAPTVLFEFSNLGAFGDYLFSQYCAQLRRGSIAKSDELEMNPAAVLQKRQRIEVSAVNHKDSQSGALDNELQRLWAEAEMMLQTDSDSAVKSANSRFAENEAPAPSRVQTSGNIPVSYRSPASRDAQRSVPADPVAIIGMAGIMPQCDDLGTFWEALRQGHDLITEVPSERWNWRNYLNDQNADDPLTAARWGGFLKQVESFDASFFGISPYEAKLMDPQQRLFLQVVWHTLEDAGYKASDLAGSSTGVYVGVSTSDYFELMRVRHASIDAHTATGYAHSILANRISYLFDFHGPSEPVDTACSSSLVAVHRAVEALQSGSCELAIAGGVNLLLTPTMFVSFAKAGMLSPDGRCRTFDQRANGYVRGEGAGAILLKPLNRALAAGDHIYALIRGSAENHGGRATSMTAPNPNAQADLLVDAYTRAGVNPATVTYIEAHGTGTQLGDPLEVTGLKKAFARLYDLHGISNDGGRRCGIGSVKANIGHLESAAGIAGVLKTLLAMQNQFLPPNPHLESQNSYIDLEGTPFYLISKGERWSQLVDPRNEPIPLRAGVSSFGFGGAYAHVILEDYAQKGAGTLATERDMPQPVLISAATRQCLDAYAQRWVSFTGNCLNHQSGLKSPTFRDVAFTSRIGRTSQAHRIALIASSFAELDDLLQLFLKRLEDARILRSFAAGDDPGNEVGLMNGFGPAPDRLTSSPTDLMTLARLWSQGQAVNWPRTEGRRVSIPLYPFRQIRCWFEETAMRLGTKGGDDYEQSPQINAQSALFHGARWTESSLLVDGSERLENLSGPLLIIGPRVFLDAVFESEPMRRMAEKMLLVLAAYDNEFSEVTENFYRVNIQDEAGFDQLFESLTARGVSPHRVIFFSESLLPFCPGLRMPKNYLFKDRLEEHLRALFCLSRAIWRRECEERVSGCYFLHASGGIDHAREAAFSAFALSGYLENGCFPFHTVELEGNSWSTEGLIALAIKETMADRQVPEEVLYREGNRRYVRKLRECQLTQSPAKRSFRQGGTYLISGGLGELGSRLAGYLARQYKCSVILLGRRALTSAVESQLAGIDRGGGTLSYYQADLCDAPALSDILERIREEHGDLQGVFHLARSVEDGPIVSKEFASFVRVSDPKVAGTLNLDASTARDPLDFFILFSSIAGEWGLAGAADYAYACSFQNRFAAIREQWSKLGRRAGKTLAIGWPQWRCDNYSNAARNRFLEERGFILLDLDIGMRFLERVLSEQETTIAFAYGDLAALRPLLNVQAREGSFSRGNSVFRAAEALVSNSGHAVEEIRSLLQNLPEEELDDLYRECTRGMSCNSPGNVNHTPSPANDRIGKERPTFEEIRATVRRVVGELLQYDPVRIDGKTAFERYGMDSILSVKAAHRLGRLLQLTLSPKWLIEQPTVDSLAEKIENQLPGVSWERKPRRTNSR